MITKLICSICKYLMTLLMNINDCAKCRGPALLALSGSHWLRNPLKIIRLMWTVVWGPQIQTQKKLMFEFSRFFQQRCQQAIFYTFCFYLFAWRKSFQWRQSCVWTHLISPVGPNVYPSGQGRHWDQVVLVCLSLWDGLFWLIASTKFGISVTEAPPLCWPVWLNLVCECELSRLVQIEQNQLLCVYFSSALMLMHVILTMNSEAMIPSTMAQKNDAMTPILMNIIAAMSFKTGREWKTKLKLLCRFISKCVLISFWALTQFPSYCVDFSLCSMYENWHQDVCSCVCPDWSPAASGLQGNKRNVWLLALPVQKRFVGNLWAKRQHTWPFVSARSI